MINRDTLLLKLRLKFLRFNEYDLKAIMDFLLEEMDLPFANEIDEELENMKELTVQTLNKIIKDDPVLAFLIETNGGVN